MSYWGIRHQPLRTTHFPAIALESSRLRRALGEAASYAHRIPCKARSPSRSQLVFGNPCPRFDLLRILARALGSGATQRHGEGQSRAPSRNFRCVSFIHFDFGGCPLKVRRPHSLSVSLAVFLILGLLVAPDAMGGLAPRCYEDVPIVVKDGFNLALGGATVALDNPALACNGGSAVATTAAGTGIALLNINGDAVEGATAKVTASKIGHDTQSRNIRISPIALPAGSESGSSVDEPEQSAGLSFEVSNNTFTLLYTLTVSQTRPALRSGETLTINVSAVVPPASAGAGRAGRIIATGADGTRTEFTQGATTGSSTAWSLLIAPPSGTPEVKVTLTLCAVNDTYAGNCGGASPGNVLSLKPTVSYIIDDTPPVVDVGSFFPGDMEQTVFSPQRLLIRATDALAGISLTASAFELTDVTTNQLVPVPGGLSYVAGWLRSEPVALVPGHDYYMRVIVEDLAGNSAGAAQIDAADHGGFFATGGTASTATARVPEAGCVLDSAMSSPGMKRAICHNVRVVVDPSTVDLMGTRVTGRGFATHEFSLAGVKVATRVAGVPLAGIAAPKPTAQWADRKINASFMVNGRTRSAATYPTDGLTVDIGTLETEVPISWDNAFLSSADRQTTSPALLACSDPSAAVRCNASGVSPNSLDLFGVTRLDDGSEISIWEKSDGWGQVQRQVLGSRASMDTAITNNETVWNLYRFFEPNPEWCGPPPIGTTCDEPYADTINDYDDEPGYGGPIDARFDDTMVYSRTTNWCEFNGNSSSKWVRTDNYAQFPTSLQVDDEFQCKGANVSVSTSGVGGVAAGDTWTYQYKSPSDMAGTVAYSHNYSVKFKGLAMYQAHRTVRASYTWYNSVPCPGCADVRTVDAEDTLAL